jgi:hypothetical protein
MDNHPNLFFYDCNEILSVPYQAKTSKQSWAIGTLQKNDHSIKLPKDKRMYMSKVNGSKE